MALTKVDSTLVDGAINTDASGNVGIGTTNPTNFGAKLAVVGGNIIADFDRTIGFQWSGGLNQYFKGMSGVPQVGGGARGLHLFNYDNDASQGIRFWGGTFASRVAFGGFDSAGRMTTPLQPAFRAVFSSSGYTAGANTELVANTATTNIGGHYSTSTGRFTAPVAGFYHFSMNIRVINTSYYSLSYRVNGGLQAFFESVGAGSQSCNQGYSINIYLNAGDYVSIFSGTQGAIASDQYAGFSGFLIG